MPKGFSEHYRALNKFKVQKKTWGSWTLVARHVFNKTYESMIRNPEFFQHTEAIQDGLVPNEKHWKVTAWNAAWTAASVTSRGERQILKSIEQKVKG